jgi:exosortase/archaeosortase family protein
MEVYYRCTGLLPAAFVAVAVLAFPVPARLRWKGLVGGVPLVLAVNFARLVGLRAVGVELHRHFDVSHRVVGEWLIVLTVTAYWVLWARWAVSSESVGETGR